MSKFNEVIFSLEEFNRLDESEKAPYIESLFGEIVDDNGFSDDEEDEMLLEELVDVSDSEETIGGQEELECISDDDVEDDEEESLTAADGTEWTDVPNTSRQTVRDNIVQQRNIRYKRTAMYSILQTFKCFMSLEMVDIIIRNTNSKANVCYTKYNNNYPNAVPKVWKPVTVSEFYAFLGVLITTGANSNCNDSARDLWTERNFPLYRAAMGVNRFCSLLRFIRFDKAATRQLRMQTDKVAPISELWSMLNRNLHEYNKSSDSLTIHEQLFPYRGRTSFTQYIPSKPAKNGIKVWWICDAKNLYPLQGQIYTGMQATDREERQGERVVKELAVNYKNSGHNITMDNFFTTLQLCELLLSWKLTVVGTLRKNEAYIPNAMKANRNRPIGSTKFAFKDSVTMCSYVPKKNKAVILLSTMHQGNDICESGKPEILHFYNKNKGGVDVMDKLLSEYTTQRQTKRWPLSFFFNMLDVAALATYILYHENNPMIKKSSIRRKLFLRQLGEELCMPQIEQRALNQQIMRHASTRKAVECYVVPHPFNLEPSTSSQGHKNSYTGTCYVCHLQPENKSRRTRKSCSMCGKPMCLEHCVTDFMCVLCAK